MLSARPVALPEGHWLLAYADSFESPRWLVVEEGESVDDAVDRLGAPKRNEKNEFRCFVGMDLQKDLHVRPEAGEIAYVRLVPRDLTTVIIILTVISLAATIASLVISLTQKQEERDAQNRFDSPTLRGARNQVAPFEPIPRVYGKARFKPPLGAYSYTEILGTDHFLRCLFVVGYGPLAMDTADMRIGETPIAEFQNLEIEVLPGELDDPPLTLYPVQVTQEDLNITLHDPGMDRDDLVPGEPEGGTGWQARTTDTQTDEIGLELILPGGVGNVTSKGRNQDAALHWAIEYRLVGAPAWTPVPKSILRLSSLVETTQPGIDEIGGAQIRVLGFRLGQFPIGINFPVFPRGQYEVRIRSTSPSFIREGAFNSQASNTLFCESRWVALKSFRNEAPWKLPGIAMVALRIRASDQLQGTVDDFSLIARALLPTWDGLHWTPPIETRNPAWACADVLRGAANPEPVPDHLIDADRFLAWANRNEAHQTPNDAGVMVSNPMYFDGVIDYRSTVYRALTDIGAVARGTPHMRDGFFSVVFDRDRSAEPPVQMITAANVVAGTFASRKLFVEEAHAYRISFKNAEKDYGDDEIILFTEGYDATTARIYEKIEWLGITDPDRAVDETRFMVSERRHRPEIYRFDMDIENLTFERGDLVVFGHDVPLLGLSYGRIAKVQWDPDPHPGAISKIWLDEKCVFEFGVSYGVRIRNHQTVLQVMDSVPVVNPATASGDVETNEIIFQTPIPAQEPGIQAAPYGPWVGDLVSFGEIGVETRRCVVRSITPQHDLTATVELMDEGAAIFADLSEPIPIYDPGINRPRDLPPLAPQILELKGDYVNLIVVFKLLGGFGRAVTRCEVQVRVSPGGPWEDVPPVAPAGLVNVTIPGLVLDLYYDVQVRAVGANGLFSPWALREHFFHASHPVDIERYAISDLRLDNFVVDPDQFVGPASSFRWQIALLEGTDAGDPLSEAPRQGSTLRESEIDRFDGYLVRIREATFDLDQGRYLPGAIVNEELVATGRYTYSYDHNVDDGGPRRAIFVEVAAQIDGLLTDFAEKLAVNPPPAVPEVVSISGLSGTRIEITLANEAVDADWEGFVVWTSLVPGFVPTLDNLIFKGRVDKQIVVPAKPGSTVYFRFASYDKFSSDPAVLNLSDEQAIEVGSIPGGVEQVVSVAIQRAALQFVPDYTGTLSPYFAALPARHYYRMHTDVRFDSKYNGVLQISHEMMVAIRYVGSSTVRPAFLYELFFTYSIGASPSGPASELLIAAPIYGSITAGGGPKVEIYEEFSWPPSSAAKWTRFRNETSIQVVANETYWINAWMSQTGSNEFWSYFDAMTMQQVIKI